MHFTCRSFIGKPQEGSWSQYWENEPDDPVLIQKKGHLFGLINLKSVAADKDTSIVGHDIIFEINQNFFSAESDNLDDNVKNAILSVINNPLYKENEMEILIAIVAGNQVHFASFGPSNIIFNRGTRISILLEGANDIKNISGPLLPEDKFFLTTSAFFEKITWDKIKSVLSSDNIQNIEENFLSLLYSFDNQSDLASVLIQSHSDEGDIVEAEPETPSQSNLLDSIVPPSLVSKKINFKKIFSVFKRKDKPPVYVSHHDISQVNKRKKINIFIAIILILALSTSFYFGYQKNQKNKAEKLYQDLKSQLDQKIENIAAVKNINIESAQNLAKESENLLQQMTKLNINSADISHYHSQIDQILNQTGAANNFSPEVFYDTSSEIKNAQFSKISLNNNQLFLLDSVNGRLDSVDINKKSTQNISKIDKLKNTVDVVFNKNDIYVANGNTIFLVKNNSIDPKISLSTTTLNDFYFWNGAAYVLDAANLNILKITPNSSGFGAPQTWLKNNLKLNPNTTSITIDGKIWVLSADGQITPFASGIKDTFNPSQTSQFTQAKNIDIGLDNDFIAFTDNDNLVYVYKKSGELKAKYNFNDLKISDIAMDEKDNIIFVLCSDQKIYKINL